VKQAYCVAGLGWGDEGKGSTTQWLVEQYNADLIVKYSGGCQAAHNVVDETGRRFTFSQLGSTLRDNVPTYIWRNFIVDPLAMLNEADGLRDFLGNDKDPLRNVYVHPDCPIIEGHHIHWNRNEKAAHKHGTCGRGVGECRNQFRTQRENSISAYDLIAGNLKEFDLIPRFIEWVSRVHIREHPPEFKTAVFEGSQGILLDESVGFHPHTTWSTVRFDAAHFCYKHLKIEQHQNIGVIRTYHTRHGAGPFPTECDLGLTDSGNPTGEFQGPMRYGRFDYVLFNYATENAGDKLDRIVITHCDQDQKFRCVCYQLPNGEIVDTLPRPACIEDQVELCNFLKTVKFVVSDASWVSISKWQPNLTPILFRSFGPKPSDKELISGF
jgi:adenylosuccinate synthase